MDESPADNRFMDSLLFRSLKGGTTQAEDEMVAEWRRSATENETHFAELARLLDLTADAYAPTGLAVGPAPAASDLLRTGVAQAGSAAATRADGRAPRSSRMLLAGLGAAAAAAIVMLVLVQSWPAPADSLLSLGVDEFATGPSDVATVQLRDGTVVRLAPQSRLRLTGSAGEREVTLDGRAYFAVAEMADRPFTVKTRGGDAVVLGTRFEAEATGEELRVLVVEGRVALAAAGTRVELGAYEMARAVEGALSAPVDVPDAERRIEWVGNFLVFQRTPIEDVAAQMQEHLGIEVELVGDEPDALTVTAWFVDPTADDVIRVVCKVIAASCLRDGARVTIDLTPTTL